MIPFFSPASDISLLFKKQVEVRRGKSINKTISKSRSLTAAELLNDAKM